MNFSITLPALRSYLMEYALANNYDLPPDETIEEAVKALYVFPEAQGVGKLSPEPREMAEQIFFHVLLRGGEGNPFTKIRNEWFIELAAPKIAELLEGK